MKGKWSPLVEVGIVAAGMCLFALFSHSALPFKLLSAGGLFLATIAILKGLKTEISPAAVLGLHYFSRVVAVYFVFGSLIGVALGFLYRCGYGLEFQLSAFGGFAPLAALIGATEEILYRGYIQGRLCSLSPLPAITCASLCHTSYKCALFAFTPFPMQINLAFFGTCTFMVGFAFGALRQHTGSILPPLAAHACFDIIAYGDCSHAPWWVWS